ncbi:MAG: hypothetical protein ACRDCT_20085, partial [Shewanella sp.]
QFNKTRNVMFRYLSHILLHSIELLSSQQWEHSQSNRVDIDTIYDIQKWEQSHKLKAITLFVLCPLRQSRKIGNKASNKLMHPYNQKNMNWLE